AEAGGDRSARRTGAVSSGGREGRPGSAALDRGPSGGPAWGSPRPLRRTGPGRRRDADPEGRPALEGGWLRGLPLPPRPAARLLRVRGQPARRALRRASRVSRWTSLDDASRRLLELPGLIGESAPARGQVVRDPEDSAGADGGNGRERVESELLQDRPRRSRRVTRLESDPRRSAGLPRAGEIRLSRPAGYNFHWRMMLKPMK